MAHCFNYIVKCVCIDHNGKEIRTVSIRAKNKLSQFDAIAGTEDYIKSKDRNVMKIRLIECIPDNLAAVGQSIHDFFSTMQGLNFDGRDKR